MILALGFFDTRTNLALPIVGARYNLAFVTVHAGLSLTIHLFFPCFMFSTDFVSIMSPPTILSPLLGSTQT